MGLRIFHLCPKGCTSAPKSLPRLAIYLPLPIYIHLKFFPFTCCYQDFPHTGLKLILYFPKHTVLSVIKFFPISC